MENKNVAILVIVIICLYFLFRWLFSRKTKVLIKSPTKAMNEGSAPLKIFTPKEIGKPSITSNFTYSVWIYVKDWSVGLGEEKIIFSRKQVGSSAGETVISPEISLGPNNNNLIIKNTTYTDSGGSSLSQCNIKNIPLQKWVNIFVSMNTRTLDVYMNGKLVRTCIFDGPAKLANNGNLEVCPGGGFSGYISYLQYWNTSSSPQQAWDTYKKGFGGGLLQSLLNKYKLKLTFLADNEEKGSLML